jgi:hypothetical protein
MGMGAAQDLAVNHARDLEIAGVSGFAGHFSVAIHAFEVFANGPCHKMLLIPKRYA